MLTCERFNIICLSELPTTSRNLECNIVLLISFADGLNGTYLSRDGEEQNKLKNTYNIKKYNFVIFSTSQVERTSVRLVYCMPFGSK